jgi:lipoprotein-anchoring transpeptidase ErfK/SrfK
VPEPEAPTTTTTAHPVYTVAVAAVARVPVFETPTEGQPVHTLRSPRPPSDNPLPFLVVEEQPEWLNVMLPVRPNGSTGWVRRSDVSLHTHAFRIVVELGAHRLTVYEGVDVVLQEPVGLGVATTPTPGGIFYTTELYAVDPSQPYYGPYAFGLSGYSEVLYSFAGGDGQLAIHGTDDPSGIGRNVSNGCIRLRNEAITQLAHTLPLGVPVEVRA